MRPATDQPCFRLRSRGPLVLLVACAVTLAAAARVVGGTHPQPVLLDALLWLGASAAAIGWYACVRRISVRVKYRWRASLDARETRLAVARRDLLVAARGDRSIVAAADHRWPGDPDAFALIVAIAARALQAASAFLLGLGIVAIGMGVPDPIAAESGAPTIAYALSLSFHAVLASWLDLGWRWLGWRAGVRVVDRARRLMESA